VSFAYPAGGTPSRRIRKVLRRLAAAPFDLEEFCGHLEQQSGRRVHLVATDLDAGAPSGVCARTQDEDYLYYERQTSPFHQAHILMCLAAEVLLGGGPQRSGVDRRLFPGVSPRLAELMLGPAERPPAGPLEAELFALRAMERAGVSSCPSSLSRWFLRQLKPLHSALLDAVPEAGRPVGPAPESARLRLHRQVVEIRDAALALRPYRTAGVAGHAAAVARVAGLRGEPYAASVEAGSLAGAIAASRQGPPVSQPESSAWRVPFDPRPDLRSEAAWLARVSRAFARLQPAPEPPTGGWHPGFHAGGQPVADGEETLWRKAK
jgi:hypothetical protein